VAIQHNIRGLTKKARPRETLGGSKGKELHLCLLSRHRDVDGFLRRNEMIEAYGVLGNGELHALDVARKLVPARSVVR
jgi:hypothetical protein